MHQASSVVASGGFRKGEHGLRKFSVELRLGVAEGRLNVYKLLKVVEASVHGNRLAGSAKVVGGSVGKLDSRGGGRELSGGRSPFNSGSFVEEVCGREVSDTFLLDAVDLQGLLVFRVEFGGDDLDDHISELLLGVDVGVEIGLASFDGSKDGLQRVTTFFHITLDLPVKLDIRGDIKVKAEVNKVSDTVIVEGVESLENDNGRGFNGLGGVKSSVDVVVDGLGDALSVLEGLDLFVHQVEVVFKGVQGGQAGDLTSVTVVQVVVIKADDRGKVRDQGVGLPSTVTETTSEGSDDVSSEDAGKTTHECRLSTTRIGGDTDNDGGLSLLQGHSKAAGRGRSGNIAGDEGRGSEGGNRAKGSGKGNKLHCISFNNRRLTVG